MALYQYLFDFYHSHPAINTLASFLIGSGITYFFTRIGDNRKIKIEKAEKTYNLLQELLFSVHDFYTLYSLNRNLVLPEKEVIKRSEEYSKDLEAKMIYIDFILNCYLKPYKSFYEAHKINSYISF